MQGLDGDKLQLRHPDPRGGQGLHEVVEPPVARPLRRGQQAQVVPLVQFPPRVPEEFPLAAEGFHPALPPAQEGEEGVQGRQLAVDRAGGVALGQGGLPGQDGFLLHRLPRFQVPGKVLHLPEVFGNGGRAALRLLQMPLESGQGFPGDDAWFHRAFPPYSFPPSVPANARAR